MDQDTWRFINTFAPWASAIGTIIAVVTSLYLARRSDRQKLEVPIGLRIVPHLDVPRHEVLWVGITNVSRRTTTITLLYLQPVPWRKRSFPLIPVQGSAYTASLPTTLDDGKAADYMWPRFMLEETFKHCGDEFTGWWGAVRLHLMCLCVATSTGLVFRRKPEKELLQLFKELAKKPIR